jgi:hypothetical protein
MKWLAVVAAVTVVAIGVVLWMISGSTAHAPTIQAANWSLTSAPIGNTLSISVGTGACDDFDRVDTSEDEHTVTVHAYTHAKPGLDENAPCILVLIPYPVTVQLAAPLGDRTLVGCDVRAAQAPIDCRRIGY